MIKCITVECQNPNYSECLKSELTSVRISVFGATVYIYSKWSRLVLASRFRTTTRCLKSALVRISVKHCKLKIICLIKTMQLPGAPTQRTAALLLATVWRELWPNTSCPNLKKSPPWTDKNCHSKCRSDSHLLFAHLCILSIIHLFTDT